MWELKMAGPGMLLPEMGRGWGAGGGPQMLQVRRQLQVTCPGEHSKGFALVVGPPPKAELLLGCTSCPGAVLSHTFQKPRDPAERGVCQLQPSTDTSWRRTSSLSRGQPFRKANFFQWLDTFWLTMGFPHSSVGKDSAFSSFSRTIDGLPW